MNLSESEYAELVAIAKNILIKNRAAQLSFNEFDLVNDIYLEYPGITRKEFISKLQTHFHKERNTSFILNSQDFDNNFREESKVCAKCKKDIPIMLFRKVINKGKERYYDYCRDCYNKQQREIMKRRYNSISPSIRKMERNKRNAVKRINPIAFSNINDFTENFINAYEKIGLT